MSSRVLISYHPYSATDPGIPGKQIGHWPCSWISLPEIGDEPHTAAYRLRFRSAKQETVRIHVSADERYVLFLDGCLLGRGPERGAPDCWFFETYDLDLAPGEHVLAARAWYMGEKLRPTAQMSVHPGFILSPEGDDETIKRLGTGRAPWEGKRLSGYSLLKPVNAWGTGACTCLRPEACDRDHEQGGGEGWAPVETGLPGFHPELKQVNVPRSHLLHPAPLPPMMYEPRRIGTVRFIEQPDTADPFELTRRQVLERNAIEQEKAAWTALLHKGKPLTIARGTRRRVLVDLDDYYCAYPVLTASGGAGATIHLEWAESLYHELKTTWDAPPTFIYGRSKGNRDEISGKYFVGERDTFLPDGGPDRVYEPLWWQAGRYVQWVIQTADEPLTLDAFELRETRYPMQAESSFECDDPGFMAALPLMQRALLTGAHECYFDCPYYEQLMYLGDTRLEALVTAGLTHDSRLPEKAIRMFNISRRSDGLPQGRFPSDHFIILRLFSLYWTNMIYDYACWQNNLPLVRSWMPPLRNVLDVWWSFKDDNGSIRSPGSWNFVDWTNAPGWVRHAPPGGGDGFCAVVNWHLIYSLTRAAELEDCVGEPEMAQLHRRRAQELADAAVRLFWNEERGLFADDPSHDYFSEHAQCFALLSGLTDPARTRRIEQALGAGDGIVKATIYFSHYYLEVCRMLERMDWFSERLNIWRALPGIGMKTTYEMPDPTRSDNHGWGAHPIYHAFATLLGIRPASPGYRSVQIKPQLGWLTAARGKAVHPDGFIEADFRKSGDVVSGTVSLPDGIGGTLEANGQTFHLKPGVKNFQF